jgi:zinc transporter 1
LYGHPIQNRQYLLEAAHDMQQQSERDASATGAGAEDSSQIESTLQKGKLLIEVDDESQASRDGRGIDSYNHSHGAGSMNMRGLVLHVLGDALGNIGVIATGLIIWLSHWKFKYYFDPIISLFITIIIFASAMPLGEQPCSSFPIT